jgi:hypothetical protein
LFPFLGQFERGARFERSDTPAEKFAKLEMLLVQSAAEGDQAVAILANLLSLPPNDRYRLPHLSPQSRKEKTLLALLAQLERLAAMKSSSRRCPLERSDLVELSRSWWTATVRVLLLIPHGRVRPP